MARNLLLTGGIFHPFAEAAPALAGLLGEHGICSDIRTDIDAALRDLTPATDLVTVYALRWSMTQHEKYAPYRQTEALSLSAEARAALLGHVARGGGLVALHTAVICFDDWPDWPHLLGGGWVWGTSGHPPFGPAQARMTGTRHGLTAGLTPFETIDEVYGDLCLAPDTEVLAELRAHADGAVWQPALWARQQDAGRVVVDTLGHDAAALLQPIHRQILARAALWALGGSEEEISRI
jgi:hypothetical protein